MKEENKPFNDVMDHFNRIEGNASKVVKTDFKAAQTNKIFWVLYDCFLRYYLFVRADFKCITLMVCLLYPLRWHYFK